jgi:eukaryotic-like serine/threonine-protein kinase
MTLAAGRRLGPYEVLSPLGAGGMGEVYKARDTRLGRLVAIKVLPAEVASDRERRSRFEREARSASALNHPNIVTVYDIGDSESGFYIAMELIEGKTLRETLSAGPLPVARVLELAAQIAGGLAKAHDAGIVHRDLKPDNIMISRDGFAKILDFGLARLGALPTSDLSASPTVSQQTEPGIVMGTVGYMSPEQVRGTQADQRSDVFAFGSILYEMLTGQRAFAGRSTAETMSAILRDAPADPGALRPEVGPALGRIVRRCLEKEPVDRFQSTRDLAFALADPSSIRGVLSSPVTVSESRARRRRFLLGFGMGGFAALLALLFALNVGGLRDRSPRTAASRPIQSLAVLPMANYSGDPQQDYFADGMTEELITDLAQIKSLRVISRTSAMAYKGTRKTLPQIGRELNVDGVLEGSVERAGSRVRITEQLVEAATDRHLWAKSYERELKDVLALQAEVARAVAAEVQAAITPQEAARLASARAVDPKVHELYLRGRYQLNRAGSRPAIDGAIATFNRALSIDPAYAPAYAGLADSYVALTDFYLPPEETMPKAKEAAARALALDEVLAEAHVSLGMVHLGYDRDWAGAEREFRRAIELNPGLSTAHEVLGDYFAVVGRVGESSAEIEKAARLDPLSSAIAYDGGWDSVLARRYDRAVEWFRKAIELDPSNGWLDVNLAIALTQQGKLSDAAAAAEKGIAGLDSPLARAVAAGTFAAAGQRERARKMAEELERASGSRYVCPYELAVVSIRLGDRDEAFRLLEKGYRERSVCMQFTKCDPRLDPLRSDPRFADLLRRLAFPGQQVGEKGCGMALREKRNAADGPTPPAIFFPHPAKASEESR